MGDKRRTVNIEPGCPPPPVARISAAINGIKWEQLSMNMKIKVLVKFICFTGFSKCLLRRLWTLIVTGRPVEDFADLVEEEGPIYVSWLWCHLLQRQTYPTGDYFGDTIFCNYIHDELVAYENFRLYQSYFTCYFPCTRCASNQVCDVSQPSFEEQYNVENEDKTNSLNKWIYSVSRWASVEKYIEGQRRFQEQRKVEEEIWFEEYRRIEDQKQIEERRQMEVQLAVSQVNDRNETFSLEEICETEVQSAVSQVNDRNEPFYLEEIYETEVQSAVSQVNDRNETFPLEEICETEVQSAVSQVNDRNETFPLEEICETEVQSAVSQVNDRNEPFYFEEIYETEVQLAVSQVNYINETFPLEEIYESEDDLPCSFLRKWANYVSSWVEETGRNKNDSSEISSLHNTSVTSSVEEETITDDEMSEGSESAGVIPRPGHGMHTQTYNIQSQWIGDTPQQSSIVFEQGTDPTPFFPEPQLGWYFAFDGNNTKTEEAGGTFSNGDTPQQSSVVDEQGIKSYDDLLGGTVPTPFVPEPQLGWYFAFDGNNTKTEEAGDTFSNGDEEDPRRRS